MRFALIGVIAVTLSSNAALAQDPTHDWTGIYVGIEGGGGAGSSKASSACVDPAGNVFFDNSVDCADSIASGALPTSFAANLKGAIGGAEAGYNTQIDRWVFGVEADISKSGLKSSDVQVPSALVLGGLQETVGVFQDLNWLATLRGRVGYATGDILVYATGGLAAGEVDAGYALLEDQSGGFALDARSRKAVGWTAGAGAEMAFGAWSLKGEVLHYDLGKQKLSAEFNIPGDGPKGTVFNTEVETSGNLIRLGLDYHFE